MKKTLLLSVVASTMIMAGGDIAPVEPVVAAPVEAAAWNFEGQAVLYYQTVSDKRASPVVTPGHLNPAGDLFDQENSTANVGISLKASNADLFAGIGAGVKVIGLGTLGLDEDVVSAVMETGDGSLNSGAVTEAYLTYTADSIKSTWKVGRQTLPKALSPFAYSEGWNVFQNTFEAGLMVNSYFEDTTIVLAHVTGANGYGNMSDFNDINDDGVTMLTLLNKSFEGVTLTGTYYNAPDMAVVGDTDILWGDAKFAISGINIALQGGTVMVDNLDDTTSFGAKVGYDFGMFDASAAFSTVDDGTVSIRNLATGGAAKSPLYTQMVLNNIGNNIGSDNDTYVLRAGAKVLGGKLGVAYGDTADNSALGNDYAEFDVTYKTKVLDDSVTLFAAYVNQDYDIEGDNDFLRFWARYNF